MPKVTINKCKAISTKLMQTHIVTTQNIIDFMNSTIKLDLKDLWVIDIPTIIMNSNRVLYKHRYV